MKNIAATISFCTAFSFAVSAQTQPTDTPPLIFRDTFPGLALVTDSLIVMQPGKGPGDYKFVAVQGGLFVRAVMISEYQTTVRASDGATVPMNQKKRWHYANTWGTIDPNRIALFKVDDKR